MTNDQGSVIVTEPQWEYRCLHMDGGSYDSHIETKLNEMGAENWNLVDVVQDGRLLRLFFKRKSNRHILN